MTNIYFVIAFCEIGKVCCFGVVLLIIMQPPMARNNHKKVLDNLHGAFMISDLESLSSAAFEMKKYLKMTNLLHIIWRVMTKKRLLVKEWYCISYVVKTCWKSVKIFNENHVNIRKMRKTHQGMSSFYWNITVQ